MEERAKKLLGVQTEYNVTGTVHTVAGLRPGHVAGAKDAKKATILGLYREGKITPELVMRYGHTDGNGKWVPLAKMADHVEANRHGVPVAAMVAAGVDMRRMESSHAQQMGRDVAKAERLEQAAELAKPKTMLVVRKANGQAVVLKSGTVKAVAAPTPTLQQVQVAVAVVMANKRAKAKAAEAKPRLQGIEVKLSPAEQAAMLARMKAKVVVE